MNTRLQINAADTHYPQTVNAWVAHVLDEPGKPWQNTDWLDEFFADHIASLPMIVAVSEYYLSDWVFTDDELLNWEWLETPEQEAALNDADRLAFARARMESISDDLIDDAPSVFIANVVDEAGRVACVVFTALPMGQAGVDVSWSRCETGLADNEILAEEGLIDTDALMALSDEWILDRWTRSGGSSKFR